MKLARSTSSLLLFVSAAALAACSQNQEAENHREGASAIATGDSVGKLPDKGGLSLTMPAQRPGAPYDILKVLVHSSNCAYPDDNVAMPESELDPSGPMPGDVPMGGAAESTIDSIDSKLKKSDSMKLSGMDSHRGYHGRKHHGRKMDAKHGDSRENLWAPDPFHGPACTGYVFSQEFPYASDQIINITEVYGKVHFMVSLLHNGVVIEEGEGDIAVVGGDVVALPIQLHKVERSSPSVDLIIKRAETNTEQPVQPVQQDECRKQPKCPLGAVCPQYRGQDCKQEELSIDGAGHMPQPNR